MDNDKFAWTERLAQAEALTAKETECAIWGGTGGWPGIAEFVVCKPCDGTGSNVPTTTTPH